VITGSTYDNYEIVVVADDHTPQAVVEHLRATAGDRLRIVTFSRPFSFSEKINLGVGRSRGEVLLMLNDDTEVLPAGWRQLAPGAYGRSEWIEAMLMYARDPAVGAVGAKLYFADRRIQHVGIVNQRGMPGHPFYGYRGDYPGYFSNARIPVNYLAATAACLMSRREVFEEVGGLTLRLPVNFNDVDYGFKLHARGYRTVVNPDVELLHYESSTRTPEVTEYEHLELLRFWKRLMWNDPYYPRMASEDGNYVLPPYRVNGTFVDIRAGTLA
jgi:GT2 family glycosyltransferase